MKYPVGTLAGRHQALEACTVIIQAKKLWKKTAAYHYVQLFPGLRVKDSTAYFKNECSRHYQTVRLPDGRPHISETTQTL